MPSQIKRICVLLDGPAVMNFMGQALQRAQAEVGVEFPLVIIRENGDPASSMSQGKRLLAKFIYYGKRLACRELALCKKIPIEQWAVFRNAEIVYSSALRSGKNGTALPASIIRLIQSRNIDLILRRGFGIIKGEVLNCVPWGVLSYHMGRLSHYRGSMGAINAYINNEPYLYISIQRLNEKLDRGDLILQIPVDIRMAPSYRAAMNRFFESAIGSLSDAIKRMQAVDFKFSRVDFLPGRHFPFPNIWGLIRLSVRFFVADTKRRLGLNWRGKSSRQ